MDVFNSPLSIGATVVIIALIFRRDISQLLARIKRAGYGDKSVDFADPPKAAAEQEKRLEAPTTQPTATVPTSHAMPPRSKIYENIEHEIFNELNRQNLPHEIERAWLIRAIAGWRVNRDHEVTYRLIFGSQIALLLEANTPAPPNDAKARQIYDQARAAFTALYAALPFETWAQYPVSVGLLKTEGAFLKITPLGQDFLHYLVNTGLTAQKFG